MFPFIFFIKKKDLGWDQFSHLHKVVCSRTVEQRTDPDILTVSGFFHTIIRVDGGVREWRFYFKDSDSMSFSCSCLHRSPPQGCLCECTVHPGARGVFTRWRGAPGVLRGRMASLSHPLSGEAQSTPEPPPSSTASETLGLDGASLPVHPPTTFQ